MKNKTINNTNIQQEKPPKKPKNVKNKKAQRKNRRAFFVKLGTDLLSHLLRQYHWLWRA